MQAKKLIALSLIALGLAVPASADKRVGISIGTGVSIGAQIGRTSVHVGFGGPRYGYVSSRRPSCSTWIPGCYEVVSERVWIPASKQRVWVEPVYATHYDSCGRSYRVLVESGYWKWVELCGHYESRQVRRWVPGHYS